MTTTHTPCVPWKDTPSVFSKENFPELDGASCRNPNQLNSQPWCFTSTDGDWGYCNVSVCVDGKSLWGVHVPYWIVELLGQ